MNRLVFGCGYLGHRVAKQWLQRGDRVYVVTRKTDHATGFQQQGLVPIVGDVTAPETLADLPSVSTVLFAVGMDRSRYSDIRDVYVEGLRNVLQRLPDSVEQLIYISSTGVYGAMEGEWATEESPTEPRREGGQACLEAEQLIRQSRWASKSTILRLAGIYGPGRVPTRSTIDQRDWSKLSSAGHLNLIHVDDAARLIVQLADQKPEGKLFNVSDGNPVPRKQYYDFMAQLLGIEIPWENISQQIRTTRSGSDKRVSNAKLTAELDFRFDYPDYRSGLKHATAESP